MFPRSVKNSNKLGRNLSFHKRSELQNLSADEKGKQRSLLNLASHFSQYQLKVEQNSLMIIQET